MTGLIRFCRNFAIAIFGTLLFYYVIACALSLDVLNPLLLIDRIYHFVLYSSYKEVAIITSIFIFIFSSALAFICYVDYWQQRYEQEKTISNREA